MRYAIISDIHGNLDALEAVLDDIEKQGVDRIVHLGDIINYGPQPAECVEKIISLGIEGVIGNHEVALIDRLQANSFNRYAYDSIFVTRNLLSDEHLQYLESLPRNIAIDGVLLVHGTPPDSVDRYISHYDFDSRIFGLDEIMLKMEQRVAFVGHTHLLGIYTGGEEFIKKPGYDETVALDRDRTHIINVGSVGQPRDHNPCARYVIFDEDEMTVDARYVAYPVTITVEKIVKSDFLDFNGERLISGM